MLRSRAMRYFLLNDQLIPYEVPKQLWIERAPEGNWLVDRSTPVQGVVVLTRFRGKAPDGQTPPLLWETLVFGGKFTGSAKLTRSISDAVAMHNETEQAILTHWALESREPE
jgi:hypothetical protein